MYIGDLFVAFVPSFNLETNILQQHKIMFNLDVYIRQSTTMHSIMTNYNTINKKIMQAV